MKVTVEGYQSVAQSTEITVEGLTVITGESNIGKSAIIRAITALLENKLGHWFITDGKANAQVTLESNGHQVSWFKSRKTTEYRVDGREHKKAGRSAPEEVDKLGFYQVSAQGAKYRPQISQQFDRPFIIGEKSPIVAAELLASNKQSAILARAIKIGKVTLAEETTTLGVREGEI